MDQGWLCPRCGKILAPWVKECDCSAGIVYPYQPYIPYYPYTTPYTPNIWFPDYYHWNYNY